LEDSGPLAPKDIADVTPSKCALLSR